MGAYCCKPVLNPADYVNDLVAIHNPYENRREGWEMMGALVRLNEIVNVLYDPKLQCTFFGNQNSWRLLKHTFRSKCSLSDLYGEKKGYDCFKLPQFSVQVWSVFRASNNVL